MILIDLNQVVISNLMVQTGGDPAEIDENLLRHMILNSLRASARMFKEEYKEIVVCCDSKQYWRREKFPYYKAHRKTERDSSGIDWHMIFDIIDKIKEELKENLPYKVIEVEGAEADDIIATLVMNETGPILILSSDKDFLQLQKYPNVKQYSNIQKKFLTTENPEEFLQEHILRGDHSDGIPNFLSEDDVFVSGGRQKPINTKKLEEWIKLPVYQYCTTDTMKHGQSRNSMLIDFSYIPLRIQDKILRVFDETKIGSKTKMLNYFIEKGLKNLIGILDEF